MSELTYDDFKNRVNIQDLLVDAGYQLNRRDGMRYPSYVRIGSDGKRVHGDKFIVTANGLCCFQPPEIKTTMSSASSRSTRTFSPNTAPECPATGSSTWSATAS